jgi:hypothetical protein
MLRGTVGLVAALATLTTLTGCSGSSSSAQPAPGPPTPTISPCPSPSTHPHAQWPKSLPGDLPKPGDAHITDVQNTADGVHIVKFTTPTSLRDGVLFVVDKLPKAGYTLGRGDAEASEADAPFVHNNVRGLYRLFSSASCETLWLLATVDTTTTAPQGGSPVLPSYTPSSSPSPLPFG